MLISVWIERSQPLAGTAAIEGGEPLRFDGRWLELPQSGLRTGRLGARKWRSWGGRER